MASTLIIGLNVTAVLKNDPKTKDIPILIISVIEDREKGLRLGASAYLSKPFEADEVLDTIGRLLRGGNRKILVVDDDESLVTTIKFELESKGFLVLVAYDGPEALKATEQQHPDLIILDIGIPNMNGHEIMKALKDNPTTAGIPVVVLTGLEIDGSNVNSLALGASEYVIKSGGLEKLYEAIENVLNGVSSDR